MHRIVWILVSGVLVLSCDKNESLSSSENILPKESFIPLLVDLQVLESYYQRVYNRPNAYKNSLDSSSVLVFNKYGTTKKDFDRSFSYYAADLDQIYAIYEAALDSLNFRINDAVY